MLYTISLVLIGLWLEGLVTSFTMGGFIHILLVIAIILALVNLMEEKGKKYERVQRAYGSFGRSFPLTDDVGPTKAGAESKDSARNARRVKDEQNKPRELEAKAS